MRLSCKLSFQSTRDGSRKPGIQPQQNSCTKYLRIGCTNAPLQIVPLKQTVSTMASTRDHELYLWSAWVLCEMRGNELGLVFGHQT